ncbi:hypothetical protein V1514DRAFT_308965 [Lipomyces japonicus]|uniref:uncharacterized protein n=1 Tax=Lipomyces japonicus TaxID=56871 RepID=UPI0034CDD571
MNGLRAISRTLPRLPTTTTATMMMTRRTARMQVQRRVNSTQSSGTGSASSNDGYFKRLAKKYGWPVLYVYLGLSVLDYPICFAVVHGAGQEKIGEFEHAVAEYGRQAWDFVRARVLGTTVASNDGGHDDERNNTSTSTSTSTTSSNEVRKGSLLTEAAIAYGIHKSLIFIRLPIAIAITPGLVKLGRRHLPSLFATKASRFGIKPDGKRRFGGWLF